MMSPFDFNQDEMLTFFAVLVRYSVLMSVLPIFGERMVPQPVKVLLSLAFAAVLFPALVANHIIRPSDARIWGATTSGILGVVATETVFGLVMGFTARIGFEAITFGGNLVGNFMGYGMASTYDPNQQSHTQVVAEVQSTLAILIFLVLDGHHQMIRAALQSYSILGLGGMSSGSTSNSLMHLGPSFSQRLVEMTGQVIKYAIQISAPVALSLFGVNLAFGVMARAMPQLNILVLSVTVSAVIGLLVLWLSMPEYQGAAANILGRTGESMEIMMRSMK